VQYVRLRKGADRLDGSPWIRKARVSRVQGPAIVGDLAQVEDRDGEVLGFGLYAAGADIAVRLVTLGAAEPPHDWLERRIRAALQARAAYGYGEADMTGYREINSEGDCLPGLVVDRYGPDRVVQLGSAAMGALETRIATALGDVPGRTFVTVEPGAAKREGVSAATPPPQDDGPLQFCEHGLSFETAAPPGQKTGAYLDQRDNRVAVARLVATTGCGDVLDVGCHVGGFALHAARAGARVVALDQSAVALRHGRVNEAANDLVGITWVEADMFSQLDEVLGDREFGTIIADPPRIQTGRRDRGRPTHALGGLVRRLARRVAPFGHLVLCSCSFHLGREQLDAVVTAAGEGEFVRVAALGQPEDHPVWPGHAEGEYLRVNIYQRRLV